MCRLSFSWFVVMVLGLAGQSPARAAGTELMVLGTWAGQHGAGTTAGTRVIRTEDEWVSFLGFVESPSPRPFNPRQETVVVVMLGERRTGGYSVEVLRAWTENRQLVLECRENRPAPDMMVTQAITYPWVAAFIQRTNLPVVVRFVPSPAPAKK